MPSRRSAQAVPAAVDRRRRPRQASTTDCTACKTASAALQSAGQRAPERAQQRSTTPLQTEGKSIQAAVDALNGKQPDAALQARIKAFQTKQQQGAQELAARSSSQIQRNQQYIQQQISAKLGPIYQQVMQRRGANVLLETGSTLAPRPRVDVTNDVLAALNAALPTIVDDRAGAASSSSRRAAKRR